MNVQIIGPIIAVSVGVMAIFLLAFLGSKIVQRYLGISRGGATLIFFLSFLVGGWCGLIRHSQLQSRLGAMGPELGFLGRPLLVSAPLVTVLFAGFGAGIAVLFMAKLYVKLIAENLTEAEKSPGAEGIRAWLRGGNLACAILISLCAFLGMGESFWSVLALTFAALMVYPIFNFIFAATPVEPNSEMEALPRERERVLRMLDEGKITAPEAAELLNALGPAVESSRPAASQTRSPHRRMVLVGVCLLLVGFFLPWFSYDANKELNRVVGGMFGAVAPNLPAPGFNVGVSSVHIFGGDVRYGLGWLVLLLGIATAVLPQVIGPIPPQVKQRGVLGTLGLGAIILVYLLTQNLRFVSVGILMAMVGYALQFMGTLKEGKVRLS